MSCHALQTISRMNGNLFFFFSLLTDKSKTRVHRKSISGAGRSHIVNLKQESSTSHERYSRLVEKDD